MTATYGLGNANAKWQAQSYQLFIHLSLIQCPIIPQLFYLIRNGKLCLLAAKIVNDILITGEQHAVDQFLNGFYSKYKFGTVAHGPGQLRQLRFFGFNIVQEDDFTCSINGDEKLKALEQCPIPRVRKLELESELTAAERSAFMSLNSSLGWLGIAASPFCAFYSSYMQKMLPSANVPVLPAQTAALCVVKTLGSNISFPNPDKGDHEV